MITPGAGPPVTWQALAAVTAGFEPEDDSELLGWMAAEAAGLAAYAEALTATYDACVHVAGLDPAALAALHAVAGAAAGGAAAMAAARAAFASHYGQVREFAARGGQLPYAARWLTGSEDAPPSHPAGPVPGTGPATAPIGKHPMNIYTTARRFVCPAGHGDLLGGMAIIPDSSGLAPAACMICGHGIVPEGGLLAGSWKIQPCGCIPPPDGWVGPLATPAGASTASARPGARSAPSAGPACATGCTTSALSVTAKSVSPAPRRAAASGPSCCPPGRSPAGNAAARAAAIVRRQGRSPEARKSTALLAKARPRSRAPHVRARGSPAARQDHPKTPARRAPRRGAYDPGRAPASGDVRARPHHPHQVREAPSS